MASLYQRYGVYYITFYKNKKRVRKAISRDVRVAKEALKDIIADGEIRKRYNVNKRLKIGVQYCPVCGKFMGAK